MTDADKETSPKDESKRLLKVATTCPDTILVSASKLRFKGSYSDVFRSPQGL